MTNFDALYKEHSEWVLLMVARGMAARRSCPQQTCAGCVLKDGEDHMCMASPQEIFDWLQKENTNEQRA